MIVVVEGKTDKNFLIAYLEFLEKGAHLKYPIEDKNILVSGGKDGLKNNDDSDDNTKDSNVSTKIKQKIQEGEKILIIFDADNNYEESKQNIEKQLKQLFKESGVEENYDIFLMPNNKDKGTLEDLLEKIAKCKGVLKCFDKYCKCIKIVQKKSMQEKESTEVQIQLYRKKTKIYAYFEALGCIIEEKKDEEKKDEEKKDEEKKDEEKKGKKFKIDDRFFDLEDEYLKPLKNFLKQ